jgi:hypothetical protein
MVLKQQAHLAPMENQQGVPSSESFQVANPFRGRLVGPDLKAATVRARRRTESVPLIYPL